jgi:TrmH family RNA methyltransferase
LHLKKHRLEQRCFLIEGPTAVEAALHAEVLTLERIFVDAALDRVEIIAAAGATNVPIVAVDERSMRSLAQTQHPQGVIAVARFFHRDIASLADAVGRGSGACLVAVLHEINDPGNAGTLMRSAEALGCKAVCCGIAGVDPYNDKVVRASMGSMFHLPLFCYDEWAQMAGAARAAGLSVVAAEAGAADVRSVTLPARTALVVGHERRGLSGVPGADIAMRVGIPQSSRADSLNAAVAGSIVMYEIARASGCLPSAPPRTNGV